MVAQDHGAFPGDSCRSVHPDSLQCTTLKEFICVDYRSRLYSAERASICAQFASVPSSPEDRDYDRKYCNDAMKIF
jgi:hypothetical protein